MAAKLSGDSDEPIAEINIVPFVDIILVILIIFMVTTPFIMKPSINVDLPQAASGEESAPSNLNITMTAEGKIMLNGEPSTQEAVKTLAAKAIQQNPETQAIISADKQVPHGEVVSVIDSVKTAGVKKFAITIEKKN